MAISPFSLTSGGLGNDIAFNTFTTASIAPTANRLILVAIGSNRTTDADPGIPTVTGNGITYTLVDSYQINNRRRISVFRGMSAAPSAGAITISFAGINQYACRWSVMEFGGVDTSGTNGSGAVGLTASVAVTDTSVSIALGTLSPGSASYGAGYAADPSDVSETFTAGSGYSLIHALTTTTFFFGLMTEWRADGQSGVGFSLNASRTLRVIALEIKSAAAPAPANWLLGAALTLDSALLNVGSGVNITLADSDTFRVFASDEPGFVNSRLAIGYTARLTATFSDGSTAEASALLTDTTAPLVSITAPASGALVSGSIPFTAMASDNVGE